MAEIRFRVPDHLVDEAAAFGLSTEEIARDAVRKAVDKARAEQARQWTERGWTVLGPVDQSKLPSMRTVPEVAEALNIGKSRVYDLLRTGELRSVKLGKRRLIPAKCLDEFIAALEERAE